MADANLTSERNSLLALHIAISGQLLIWNISEDRPCNWTGVACQGNKVVELRLPGMGLSGPIPAQLGSLTSLHSFILARQLFELDLRQCENIEADLV